MTNTVLRAAAFLLLAVLFAGELGAQVETEPRGVPQEQAGNASSPEYREEVSPPSGESVEIPQAVEGGQVYTDPLAAEHFPPGVYPGTSPHAVDPSLSGPPLPTGRTFGGRRLLGGGIGGRIGGGTGLFRRRGHRPIFYGHPYEDAHFALDGSAYMSWDSGVPSGSPMDAGGQTLAGPVEGVSGPGLHASGGYIVTGDAGPQFMNPGSGGLTRLPARGRGIEPGTAELELQVPLGTRIWINRQQTTNQDLSGDYRGRRFYTLTGLDDASPYEVLVQACCCCGDHRAEKKFSLTAGESRRSDFPANELPPDCRAGMALPYNQLFHDGPPGVDETFESHGPPVPDAAVPPAAAPAPSLGEAASIDLLAPHLHPLVQAAQLAKAEAETARAEAQAARAEAEAALARLQAERKRIEQNFDERIKPVDKTAQQAAEDVSKLRTDFDAFREKADSTLGTVESLAMTNKGRLNDLQPRVEQAAQKAELEEVEETVETIQQSLDNRALQTARLTMRDVGELVMFYAENPDGSLKSLNLSAAPADATPGNLTFELTSDEFPVPDGNAQLTFACAIEVPASADKPAPTIPPIQVGTRFEDRVAAVRLWDQAQPDQHLSAAIRKPLIENWGRHLRQARIFVSVTAVIGDIRLKAARRIRIQVAPLRP